MKFCFCVLLIFAFAAGAGELQEAAANGDLETVRKLIQANPAAVNARDKGTTALHEAARSGHLEIVKLLLVNGANVNSTDNFSKLTPLKLALSQQRTQVAEFLRQQGGLEKVAPAPAFPSVANQTPQPFPLFNSNPASNATPQVSATSPPQPTNPPAATPTNFVKEPTDAELMAIGYPIHEAARAGDIEQIKFLFKTSADLINATDEKGLTPLHVTAEKKQTNAAQLLLSLGAKINARTKGGQTPLHMAVRRGDLDMTRLLLSKGAAVNVRDNFGAPPLLVAVLLTDQPNMVSLLLENKAEVNVRNQAGVTPLGEAARVGNEFVIDLLLRAGADPNAVAGPSGATPLHFAAASGEASAVQSLLRSRANVDALDARGDTPLVYALREWRTNTIPLLRQAGGTTGAAPKLSPTEKSLVDFYERTEATLRTGKNSDKSRVLLAMNPTKADVELMFPKSAKSAWAVVDELNRQIKQAFAQPRPDAEEAREIWRVLPEPPSAGVQQWRARGLLAAELPAFSLVVEKTGTTTRPGDFCFVNGHWVLVPPLRNIAAQMASSPNGVR
jgi:ankyrin repeat protein